MSKFAGVMLFCIGAVAALYWFILMVGYYKDALSELLGARARGDKVFVPASFAAGDIWIELTLPEYLEYQKKMIHWLFYPRTPWGKCFAEYIGEEMEKIMCGGAPERYSPRTA